MTVEELMDVLKNYDANATVYIGIDGKKYDANIVHHTSWVGYTINEGVVIAN